MSRSTATFAIAVTDWIGGPHMYGVGGGVGGRGGGNRYYSRGYAGYMIYYKSSDKQEYQ